MKLRLIAALVAVILHVPQLSLAQNASGLASNSLNEHIRQALAQNSSLKSAYSSYIAATNRISQLTALPDPKLSYGYFINSVETRVGPQEHKIGISQSFPWFGTLSLRGDVADAEARAELNRFLSLKNKTVYKVTKSYVELAYIDSAIGVTKDTIQLVQSWENVLQERFRTSSGSHADLVRVQVELGKLEDKLAELNDIKIPMQIQLNSLLNQEELIATKIDEHFLSKAIPSKNKDISIRDVLQGNPELQMIASVIEAKKKGVKLAEKKFYPDFTLGVDYVVTGDRDVAGGGDDAVMSVVSINLPIFWDKNKAGLNEAKAKQRSFEELKRDKEFSLRSELSKAKFELRDAKRKISLYKDTLIPKTQESIEASYTAYEAGDTSFLDVIDSEERLLEFQLTLKRAQANSITALSKLRMLAGHFNELQSVEKEK